MVEKRKPKFEVLLTGEMRRKFGLTAENRTVIRLDPSAVPSALRHLIPLAEQYGVGDDLIREDIVTKPPECELVALRAAVAAQDDAFDIWLVGPAADGPNYSPEYLAFSCLRMVADGV